MSEPAGRNEHDEERDRRATNIFLLVMFAIIVGAGVWLANAMVDYRNLDNCLAQGRRDCGTVTIEPAR
jgi:hypothetical protein